VFKAWYAAKGYANGLMVIEDKICLFLNTEVVGRESRAKGYVKEKAERGKAKDEKLAAKEVEKAEERLIGPKKRFKKAKSTHPRPSPPVNVPIEQDDLFISRPHDPQDPEVEEYETDPEVDDEKAFIRTIGASTVKQYVSSFIEIWGEQYKDKLNLYLSVRGKQFKDLLDVVKRTD
jgi:hypothetical protein